MGDNTGDGDYGKPDGCSSSMTDTVGEGVSSVALLCGALVMGDDTGAKGSGISMSIKTTVS
jgi:hypothetical protein